MQQIKDYNASTVFWQANATDFRGAITQETLGNGIITNRNFDSITGRLSNVQSGIGGSAAVQNESYLFDLVGNVTQRQNGNLGLTENFYYDNLYRLDHSTLGGTPNLQMYYDAMGNITGRSDIAGGATWTYDPTKKHAVRQAGSASYTYTYDNNGNAITRNGYAISWTSYNYPSVINGPNKSMTFSYGYDRQRIKQTYANGATSEVTMYVGGMLEKVTAGSVTDWRHYIRAGSQIVAVMSRQSTGTNTTRYTLEDHQGSVAQITDAAGAVYVSESFNAFGTRRDASTWSGSCMCTDLQKINGVTHVGYTGQEAIGGVSMGLVHMNGRVQDAVTGRFLSADPYVSDPGRTQGYNRYSYVNNNPLSYIDPSGWGSENEIPNNPSPAPGTDVPSGGPPVEVDASRIWEFDNFVRDLQNQILDRARGGGDRGSGSGSSPGIETVVTTRKKLTPPSVPPRRCTKWAQVTMGATATALGVAQAADGAVETIGGLAGAPETAGTSLIIFAKGMTDVGLGSVAAKDGWSTLQTGFDGVNRGSVFGNLGESFAGETGKNLGELLNAALGVKGLAKAIKTNKANSSGFMADLLNFMLPSDMLESLSPCG